MSSSLDDFACGGLGLAGGFDAEGGDRSADAAAVCEGETEAAPEGATEAADAIAAIEGVVATAVASAVGALVLPAASRPAGAFAESRATAAAHVAKAMTAIATATFGIRFAPCAKFRVDTATMLSGPVVASDGWGGRTA